MGGEESRPVGRVTLFLVVLNALVFGIGIGLQYVAANRMPSFQEFNAGKIRFWSQPKAYRPAGQASPPGKTAAAAVPPVVAVSAAAPASAVLCLSASDLTQSDFQDLQALLKSSGLDRSKCSYSFARKLAWWVFWPPEYEASQRDKALKSMHAAGIKEMIHVTQGPMAQAYSVGAFTAESQARQYRDALRSKGLDKIEYGPRPDNGPARIECTEVDPNRLARFKAAMPAWAKLEDQAQCAVKTTASEN